MTKHSLITDTNPKSAVAEAYRILRTNIQFANVDKAVKTILFTSAGPDEGKSTVTANLGFVMAQAGKKILIIDADMRKPIQHKIFDIDNGQGLSTTLVEDVSGLTYVSATLQDNLHVLTSGPIPPNPAELLGSNRMQRLIREAEEHYDTVLIDSPPAIALADSSILAPMVDGAILVLSAGQVTKEYALQTKERLETVGARIIGAVLNKVEMKSKEHYYYYYYYYGSDRDEDGGKKHKRRNKKSGPKN